MPSRTGGPAVAKPGMIRRLLREPEEVRPDHGVVDGPYAFARDPRMRRQFIGDPVGYSGDAVGLQVAMTQHRRWNVVAPAPPADGLGRQLIMLADDDATG